MKLFTLIVVILVLSGCTWVKVTEAGQTVSVLKSQDLSSCSNLGKVTAISRAKVAGISRSEKKLTTELETIARNEAATMGGNAVVAIAAIDGNEQVYRVYQCN
tara:strand:- start:17193 stop:17501 length:309 start_codon:yes stop_codon:yes gene_type:complete